jgi:hypothetical protein
MKLEKSEFRVEILQLLKALKTHGRKIKGEAQVQQALDIHGRTRNIGLELTLVSLLAALCDAEVLSADALQLVGLWLIEGGFMQQLEQNPQSNQIQKVILPPLDNSLPSVCYLRMPVWRADQVAALNLQDKVQSLESLERTLPPPNLEMN